MVILKHQINSFRETDLQKVLDDAGIKKLVIVGFAYANVASAEELIAGL